MRSTANLIAWRVTRGGRARTPRTEFEADLVLRVFMGSLTTH